MACVSVKELEVGRELSDEKWLVEGCGIWNFLGGFEIFDDAKF